jgi:hypothetical protein
VSSSINISPARTQVFWREHYTLEKAVRLSGGVSKGLRLSGEGQKLSGKLAGGVSKGLKLKIGQD